MKTYLECIPCFFKQALEMAKLAGAGEKKQRKILIEVSHMIPKISLESSPPAMGRTVNKLVAQITNKFDVYSSIKNKSNKLALSIYPQLKAKVARASDKLRVALELAIAGNIIDYGAKNSLNVKDELVKILKFEHKQLKKESKAVFDYPVFKRALKRAKVILYLADNAGETLFDRVLIEEILHQDKSKKIIYAVKDKPAINDALIKDAVICGVDKVAQVISSGADAPGTILSLCSKEFIKIFYKADMVISKGQGNFEALSQNRRPIFFLFMAKCPVIARVADCNLGDINLRFYPGKQKRSKLKKH